MHDNRTHPLLAQVPLTVSPFVTLPVAATLPYTYKTMPSTLPATITGIGVTGQGGSGGDTSEDGDNNNSNSNSNKPKYVVSASGHAAHPDDIIRSCRALQAHVGKMQDDAERELRELDARIRARELAERRRVAPGWLDSEARLLEPEKTSSAAAGTAGDDGVGVVAPFAEMSIEERAGASEMAVDQGEVLDRAFGGPQV